MTDKFSGRGRVWTIVNMSEWRKNWILLSARLKVILAAKSQKFAMQTAIDSPIQLELEEANPSESLETSDLNQSTGIVPLPDVIPPLTSSPTDVTPEIQPDVETLPEEDIQPFDAEEPPAAPPPLRWSWVWMAIFLISANVGAGAFLWLRSIPQATNCQQISSLATDWEKLHCAQKLAQSERLVDLLTALSVVEHWTDDRPLYPESQRLVGIWSRSLMTIARRKLYQHDLNSAIAIVGQIPSSSPIYNEVRSTIAVWKKDWDQGSDLYRQVQAAIKAKNWSLAEDLCEQYFKIDNDYWQFRLREVRKRIATDELDWKRLQRAQAIAKNPQPTQLVTAITLTQQILPGGYLWAEATQQRRTWSQQLLDIANRQLSQNQPEEAMNTARSIAGDSGLTSEAQRIIQVVRVLKGDYPERIPPSLVTQQIWETIVSLQTAQQVQPDESSYPLINDRIPKLEAYLSDLVTLQSALWVADLGQPVPIVLPLAVKQAKKIETSSPLRLEAQTKAAHWNKEILRFQDRPLLDGANRLADKGTIADTQAAIAAARKIQANHPLYPEAQRMIQGFQIRLAALEDKTLLEKAKTFARKGSLDAAIAITEQVTADRPLANEAKAIRNDIYIQQQITETQPLLDEAVNLAEGKNYTDAILLANQISWDHPLYQEAQGLISQWIAARDGLGEF